MSDTLAPDRELIRKYFECLKARNTTTESLWKQVISDFLESLKNGKLPKQGKWVYMIVALVTIAFFVNVYFVFIIILVAFIYAKRKMKPNIKLPVPEEQIDKWLRQDRLNFFETSASKLDVKIIGRWDETPIESQNVVIDKPITLSSGYYLEPKDLYWTAQFGEDYFREKGVDNRTRYTIHRFMVIYPCRNFLTIYQCYWNFLKGSSHFVETREYLYDTIVSVRNSELSLPTNEGQRFVFTEFLSLSTTDGKEIEFPAVFDKHLIDESYSGSNNSRIKRAARSIRQLLRQRRIDIQPVKISEAYDGQMPGNSWFEET
jgi:hypothetical protein